LDASKFDNIRNLPSDDLGKFLVQVNKYEINVIVKGFGGIENAEDLQDAVKLVHSVEGSLDVLKNLPSSKITEIVHDYRRFVDAGGDVGRIRKYRGNDKIADIDEFVNNNSLRYKDAKEEIITNGKFEFRTQDLKNFHGEIALKSLKDLPNGTKIYRVTYKSKNGDLRTWFTLERPKSQITWEKEWAIDRRNWHGVNPEDYKVYEFVKQSGDDLPYLQGITASQNPWIQLPGGKTQLLFEANKIPSNRLIEIGFGN
jgi:hypothetical protein